MLASTCHERETQVCILDEAGKVILEKRVKTTQDALSALFVSRAKAARRSSNHRARATARSEKREARSESEWVARLLESIGYEVVVADPSFEAMYLHRHRRVKTDRRDARTLADALERGISIALRIEGGMRNDASPRSSPYAIRSFARASSSS
jgi:hypothetical protein